MGKGTYNRERMEASVGSESSQKNEKLEKFANESSSFFEKLGYDRSVAKAPSFIERNVGSSKTRIAIYVGIILLVIGLVVFKFAVLPKLM